MNPFFHSYQTPYNIPPFEKIEDAHFREAFIEGMREQELEYEKIENNLDTPTFENTLLAIERSGSLLKKVSSVFDNLVAANTNDTLNALDVELTPKRAEHRNRFWLSTDMFARIDALYQSRDQLGLTPEQRRLLEERHRTFVQKGVQLPVEKRARLKEISKRVSSLQVAFQQNLLKEKQNYNLIVETIEELEGIPADIVAAASETAARAGHAGKWIFKATQGTLYAVLTYAQNRNLRKELYEAYVNRGNRGDEYDNNAIAVEMASLRLESAQILGYANYAEYGLSGTMAKTSDRVLSLLKSVWTPAIRRAKQERAEMQRLMGDETFQSWDWWFYAEKIRKAKYDISENSVRPYFTIDNVRDGAFSVAQKLFGIRFVERDDLPKYHEDVRTFEVKDRSDTVIGLFYCDYFTRP
ncbi:MAG: M3 family metallopeptidase, partial [Myxococcota bacterium]|nr:M3 family metallopeptidase [Myxococcota bacterium]